jgi:UDP-GlcNAc:undecaprenyl-phosphate/decaprenyl-phosphate GlcNAc-1-phosphate transferase
MEMEAALGRFQEGTDMILALTLGGISFLLALLLTPLIRDQFQGTSFVDKPDHGRKIHLRPIPRVGGIGIALSYVLSFAIMGMLPFQTWQQMKVSESFGWAILLGALVVFVSGLLDDAFNIAPWQKLFGQLTGALIIFYSGIRIQLPASLPQDEWLSLLLTVGWLIGCTNAFNLIDGMDGLAAGIGLFATITMLIAALLHNNLDLIIVTVPLAGSLMGFLRYNFNPASVFLGDCGSMLIGFLLGCFAIEWSHKSVTMLGLSAPIMAMAVPLIDVSLSVMRRLLRNRPIFGADRGHIHHRLLDRGLNQKQAALVAYSISALAAVFSLVQSAMHRDFGGLIIVLFGVAVWVGIQNLGYVEFGMASRLFFRGAFGKIVDFQALLHAFEAEIGKAQNIEEIWTAVRRSSESFGFHGTRLQILSRTYVEIEEGYQSSMQIRIPLNHGNYINFYGVDGQLHSVVLSTFLPAVLNALNAKIDSLAVEPIAPQFEKTPQKAKLARIAL